MPCRWARRLLDAGNYAQAEKYFRQSLGLSQKLRDESPALPRYRRDLAFAWANVGIALENARLYRSLEQKASEYESLKDFSENIIESINVGVVVEDVEGRIVGWNRALEALTGRGRMQTLGRRTAEIIPAK